MIELSLLGTPELLRAGDTSNAVLVQPRRLALLSYLAAAPGELQRRDRLLLLFWGDQPQARARASLRQALYFLRRSLGENIFVTRGDEEVGLNPAEVRFDVTELERAMAEGRHEDALSLYRGDFLSDFNIDAAPEFERWAGERRRELRRGVVSAAWALAEASIAAGSYETALDWTRRAIDLADYAESDVRRGMRVAIAAGTRDMGLELFATLQARLAADLDTVPDPATEDLAAELRHGGERGPSAVAPRAIAGAVDTLVAPSIPPLPSAVPARTSNRLTRLRTGAAAALVAACVIGGLIAHRYRVAHARDAMSVGRVAVFPFAVRSRAGQPAYLREGAATLLGLALDGAGRLRAVDPNAVLSASTTDIDVETGRRTAVSLGAAKYVLGEIDQAGPHLSIAATLYDVDGRSEMRATAVGDESHVFDLIDSLARRLAVGAMTDSTVRLANAAAVSTQSLGAFKSFLAGETQMRSGHYREAVTDFQSAVAADSTFGLAYYRLSLAREWTDGEISSDSAAALAEHFAAHLPDRDRKLLAARRAFVRRDLATGERLANQVLATYPTDADAWAQLGELRFHLGPNVGHSIAESRDPFLNVLRYRPNDLAARVHLTRVAADAGDSARVDEWSGRETGFGNASEIGTFELAAMRAVVLHDAHAHAALVDATSRATDAMVQSAVWRVATYTHDYDAAASIAALRGRDGFAPRSDVLLSEDIARGHVAPLHSADPRVMLRHAVFVARMLAMPSAPAIPGLARRAYDELARAAHASAERGASPAVAAARLLNARYGDSLSAMPLTGALSVADEHAMQRIVMAMHVLPATPARAFALTSVDSLDDVSVYDLGLHDILASLRAEALHAMRRDAEAIAWLDAVGLGSSASIADVPVAVRRRSELEEGEGNYMAAERDARAIATMWQGADGELRSRRCLTQSACGVK